MGSKSVEKYFPIQVTDNFFDNPKEVVKFANSLNFQNAQNGFWPGVRTESLHQNNYAFFNSFLIKLFSLIFDFKQTKVNWDNVEMYFQKTYPFDSKNKNNILNTGLIHQDGDYPLVGLVYLTENADLESGTSIMIPTKKVKDHSKIKTSLYKKPRSKWTEEDLNKYEKLIIDSNKNFEEHLKINNKFNRLIMYNGNDFHKCNSFFTGKKERLTLVFFIRQIQSSSFFPLQRAKIKTIKYKNDN